MKIKILILALLCGAISLQAQQEKIKVQLTGFVGVSAMYSTRESVTARNGNIYLWPKKIELDQEGKDLNASGEFDIDAAYSRVGVKVLGPLVWGAKSEAYLEGDFLGKSGSRDLNLRLRHAFVKLQWERSHLLVGQSWHPLFLTENYPTTVNLNAGAPFHALNRSPQIRFGYQLNQQIELLGYLLSQNDFADTGMEGAMEDSQVPEIDAQVKYRSQNGFFAALTWGYKTLKPKLYEQNAAGEKMQTDAKVESWHAGASFQQKFEKMTLKMEGVYGGAMTNLVMLGGVARKSSSLNQASYLPIRSWSTWADLQTNNPKIQPGLLVGYAENLGASQGASNIPEYSLGNDIAHLYAIAPRVKFYAAPKIWVGVEWLYTSAAYGNAWDENMKPIDTYTKHNNHFLASIRYQF